MSRPSKTSAPPAINPNRSRLKRAHRALIVVSYLIAFASLCFLIRGSSAQTGTPPPCSSGQTLTYTVTETTGAAIIPGTVDTGNFCRDCTTQITLPFPVKIYDQTFTTARASSDGNLQFVSNYTGSGFLLPSPFFDTTIFAFWSSRQFMTGIFPEGL